MLPNALIESIYITEIETWTIYVIIVLMAFYLTNKKLQLYISAVVLFLGLTVYQFYEKRTNTFNKEISLFNVKNNLLISVINNRNAFVLAEPEFIESDSKYRFHLSNYYAKKDVLKVEFFDVNNTNNDENGLYKYLLEKDILLYNQKDSSFNKNIETIIVTNKFVQYKKFEQDLEAIKPKMVIIPSGVYKKVQTKLIEILEKKQISYHAVDELGYYKITL